MKVGYEALQRGDEWSPEVHEYLKEHLSPWTKSMLTESDRTILQELRYGFAL